MAMKLKRSILLIGVFSVVLIAIILSYGTIAENGSDIDTQATANATDTRITTPDTATKSVEQQTQTITAPRQPELVTTNDSSNKQINLSAGGSTTVVVELQAVQELSDIQVSTTDPLGFTIDSDQVSINQLGSGETAIYAFSIRADRSVSRTLNIVVQANHGNHTSSQRISYSIDALNDDDDDATQDEAVQANSDAIVDTSTTDKSSNQTTFAASSSVSDIQVSGQAAYTDLDGNLHGLSHVTVHLYDIDGETNQLASTTTDQNGDFSFQLDPSDDADGDSEIQAAVEITAENDAAYVTDGDSKYTYVAETALLSPGEAVIVGSDLNNDGTQEVVSAGDNAPFQAVDWAYDGYEFSTANGISENQVPIAYPASDWPSYRYNTAGEEVIRLPERTSAAWDKTTVYHEYGHSVHLQLIDFPVIDEAGNYNCHTIVSETDPAFALIEGFAAYYSGAVAENPDAVSWGNQNLESNQFYDTSYTGNCPNGDASGEYDGLSVEGSAASIFWDITDDGPADDDSMSYAFATIAETLQTNPKGMEEFRAAWTGSDEEALDQIYTKYGIDRNPPTISYTVNESPYTENTVQFSGSVDSEREITELAISVNNGPFQTIENNNGDWEITQTLQDGTSTITVRATDAGGLTQEETRTVRVSSQDPSVSVDTVQPPALGSSDASILVNFSYTARYLDTTTIQVLKDGTAIATKSLSDLDNSPLGTTTSASVGLPEPVTTGEYTIEINVTDDSGRTAMSRYNTTFQTDSLGTISGTVVNENETGISGASVTIENQSGSTVAETITTDSGSYTVEVSPGEYTVIAKSDDATGQQTVSVDAGMTTSADIVVLSRDGPQAERELSSRHIAPGGEITVTVETEAQGNSITVSEEFSPVVAGASIESVTVNGDSRTPLINAADSSGVVITADELNSSDDVIVRYTIEVSENAEIGTLYSITGTVTSNGETPIPSDDLTVQEGSPISGVAGDYDTDSDGVITLTELSQAAVDYSDGNLSLTGLSKVATAYSNS